MTRILHRSSRSAPPVAVSAQGPWITQADGRRLLDACGGAAVSCLGHGHPRVVEAIRRQVGQLDYVHSGSFSNEAAEELAEVLVGHEPGGLTGAYFVSSGSEAMEAALKLARQFFLEHGQPQRQRFIARRQSYHGNTLGALAAGGNALRREPYAPLLADAFSHVSPAYAYRDQRDGEGEAGYAARLAAELEAEFQRLGPDTVAAFIAEPVVGATLGCAPAPAGYFRAVREVCDRHGALLILDEVMCGMGRTGTLHAWEQEGIAPDIQTVAKGLGGGFQPIGGLLIAGRILDAIRDGSGSFKHGHTYGAHPIACAAALEVQRVIQEEALLVQVQSMGERLRQGLEARLGQHPHVGDIRGRGLFQAVELVADRDSKACFGPALQVNLRIRDAALKAGMLCYPGAGTADGLHGDHVLLAPPYIASPAEIDLIVESLATAVEAVTASLPREVRA
ncbi:aspartate aminotransferase family protein [Roseomonas sp. ACRSG]|nr:aspartate aminotransferase family protein [Roseomonas sp. ACRSG]